MKWQLKKPSPIEIFLWNQTLYEVYGILSDNTKTNFAELAVGQLLPFLLVLTLDRWLKTWINLTNSD